MVNEAINKPTNNWKALNNETYHIIHRILESKRTKGQKT